MEEAFESEHKRAILRSVAAYRALCQQVSRKANGGLVFGAIMLGIWYFLIPDKGQFGKFGPFGLIYLALAALEFTSALWNKLRPSAEAMLIDGIVLFLFGASNLVRQYMLWQQGGQLSVLLILFGAYWLYAGFGHMRSYGQLRRAFSHRPTSEHLRWFDDLLREVRNANPEDDPNALELPTRPPVFGKLLGDTAIFLQAGSDDIIITALEDVEIERDPPRGPDRPIIAHLSIEGAEFGPFQLDPYNWRNYAKWKTDGGQPPPPLPPPRDRDRD